MPVKYNTNILSIFIYIYVKYFCYLDLSASELKSANFDLLISFKYKKEELHISHLGIYVCDFLFSKRTRFCKVSQCFEILTTKNLPTAGQKGMQDYKLRLV